jgi:hypothetical protein
MRGKFTATGKSTGPLVVFCLILAGLGQALAQPSSDVACKLYAVRCQGGITSPLCTRLQQRCGKLSQLDDPVEMPDCDRDQEIVIVPTCQSAATLDTGEPAGHNEGAASCTADGLRFECQKAH